MSLAQALAGYRQLVQSSPLRMKVYAEKLAKIKQVYKPSLSAWRKLLNDVRKVLQEGIEERFQTETDPTGQPWAPLKRPRPGKILTKTGKLRRSFEYPFRTDSTGMLKWIQLQVLNKVPYGVFHQEGTVKMVARPFLGFTQKMMDRIERLIKNFEKTQVK